MNFIEHSGGGRSGVELWAPEGGLYTAASDVERQLQVAGGECFRKEVLRFARPPAEFVSLFSQQPLVLWRPLLTPNHELLRYLALADAMGRKPLIWETPQDWFTPDRNLTKRALAKVPICLGGDRQGGWRLRHVKVAPLWQPGQPRIADVACFDGTPLTDFHRRLIRELIGPDVLSRAIDARAFDRAERPRALYERAFAIFTCFGVLAESFAADGAERGFVEDVVLPAFEATVRRFGTRPLIVRLLPMGTEADLYWDSYPAEALPFARWAARRCVAG